MCDYQESDYRTDSKDRQTDTGQSDPYLLLCFTGHDIDTVLYNQLSHLFIIIHR